MARKLILAAALLVGGPASAFAAEVTRVRQTMGALLRVTLKGTDEAALQIGAEEIFAEVDRWDRLLSTYKPDSEISRVNRAAPEAATVSSDTIHAAAAALAWARRTGGAFDPTMGSLIALWGFNASHPRAPSPTEIEKTKSLVGHENVECSTASLYLRLPMAGMSLDFGAVGKGWSLDRALDIIVQNKDVGEVVMDFGGQLAFWSRTDREWPAFIRHPERKEKAVRTLSLRRPGSLSTSAASERFFREASRRYGHILDPRTGYPAEGCESATVWAEKAVDADALSTALFVMGPDVAIRFADQSGIAAYILLRNGKRGLAAVTSRKWREEFGNELK